MELKRLAIELVYARPETQRVVRLDVEPGTTVRQALARSGLLDACPELDPARVRVGIFGRIGALDDALRDGDRVEIYRELLNDPKEVRRRRAREARRRS